MLRVLDWTRAVVTQEFVDAIPVSSVIGREQFLKQVVMTAQVQVEVDDHHQFSLVGTWEYVTEAQKLLADCLRRVYEDDRKASNLEKLQPKSCVKSASTSTITHKASVILRHIRKKYLTKKWELKRTVHKTRRLPSKTNPCKNIQVDSELGSNSQAAGENEVYVDITISPNSTYCQNQDQEFSSTQLAGNHENNILKNSILSECFQNSYNRHLVYINEQRADGCSKTAKIDGETVHPSDLSNGLHKSDSCKADATISTSCTKSSFNSASQDCTSIQETSTCGSTSAQNVLRETDACVKGEGKKKIKKNYEELAPFKFFCSQCSFKSKRESHYHRHLQLHSRASELFSCDMCTFTTLRLGHLRRHKMLHNDLSFTCSLCSYRTDHQKFLLRHQRIKHCNNQGRVGEQTLRCTMCMYTTTRPQFLQRHIRSHGVADGQQPRSFQCQQCSYKTTRKEHLLRHTSNVHSDHRPYLCHHCGKAFKRPDALKQHTVTHATADPALSVHHCPVCTKSCRSQSQLNQHLAVHSNVRSFLCEICGSAFKTRAVQRKHVITIHRNPKAFSCLQCSRKFNTKYALRRHNKQHSLEKKPKSEEPTASDQVTVPQVVPALEKETVLIQEPASIHIHNAAIAVQVIGYI